MNDKRLKLKLDLLTGQGLKCLWCGEYGATDLHEAFLKKGDLPTRRQKELDALIHCPENCVVLHNHCHLRYGQTRAMEFKVLGYKVSRYDMQDYFKRLQEAVPSWSSPAWDKQNGRLLIGD